MVNMQMVSHGLIIIVKYSIIDILNRVHTLSMAAFNLSNINNFLLSTYCSNSCGNAYFAKQQGRLSASGKLR